MTRVEVVATLAFGWVHPIGVTGRQRAREASLMVAGFDHCEPEEIARIQREIARIGDR